MGEVSKAWECVTYICFLVGWLCDIISSSLAGKLLCK